MFTFNSASEELLEQQRNRRMVNGIAYFRYVQQTNKEKDFGYLAPLRCSDTLKGPIQLFFGDMDQLKFGRDQSCNFVLPEDMFTDEENRKHDKE